MNTIVIVGAGPGLGLSLAKRFGKEDFRVVLIARRRQELEKYVSVLTEKGIKATSFVADVANEQQLEGAFSAIKEQFGQIDVLIYNAAIIKPVSAAETTAEIANNHLQVNLIGAISSAKLVIPEMVARKQGTIFFTGGGNSGLSAIPFLTTLSIGKSGLRSYAHCLHDELAEKGVYVAMVSIAGVIKPGTFFDPGSIAEVYYDMYQKRDCVERFFAQDGRNPADVLKVAYKKKDL